MKVGDVMRVMAAHREEDCGQIAIVLEITQAGEDRNTKQVFISIPATGANYWTYASWLDALEDLCR